jgi:LPS-assembly protein
MKNSVGTTLRLLAASSPPWPLRSGRKNRDRKFNRGWRRKLAWQFGGVLFNWPRPMIKFPAIFALFLCALLFSFSVKAQDDTNDVIEALGKVIPGLPEGTFDYDPTTGVMHWTNWVYFKHLDPLHGNTALSAKSAWVNTKTGDVQADGDVHIESGDQLWVGDHIDYNYNTHRMSSEQFRSGLAPVFVGGTQLTGFISKEKGATNELTATNTFVTTDDVSDPAYRIRASRITIIPGKTVQMWHAVFYLGSVPVFYFPYYERSLGKRVNHFTFTPGYRSRFGAEMLATYNWYVGDWADGKIHADYRSRRGPGFGPDVNLHLGQWGEASVKYYYLHDFKPNYGTNGLPFLGNIPHDRQRFYLGWQATPQTNLNVKALINYQSDPLILHDYFPSEYTENPQPNTFFEANKYWDNWSLDGLVTPRVNSFYSQVERLPDVQLTGFRQQVFDTPVYYDSQSSVGEYRSYTANTTNNLFASDAGFYTNSAARLDTYHQFTLPWTFFNWLNVTPRVGGRLTYYGQNSSAVTPRENDLYREVFNTGIEFSFKASQLWEDATNSFFQVDGLRHIIEPSANYVFVPDPSTPPAQLSQFDGELPSLLLLPVNFPDYNSIDSIDTMNVMRFGLRNVLQTKRDGELQDLVNWNMMLDWRLDPKPGQSSLNDLYSQFSFRPRTWLTLESQLRYNIDDGNLNMSFHQITLAPNNRWSWGLGHWYLRGGTWGNGTWETSDYLTSTFYYRLDDNWGVRMQHNFDFTTGRLQSQFYTLYRDMRSWTAALTFHVENNVNSSVDYTLAFQISLKASPSSSVGGDAVKSYRLVGE